VSNVALLGYFKYTDFLIQNVNMVFDTSIPLFHLALPLAISFFTFQQIAYLVDSYRGETAEYDFLNYALFVTFFPQLIAGPIVHHKEMMPQFASKWNLVKNYKNIVLGIFIFSIGLFKKVVIADGFSVWATAGFDTATTLNLFEAWVTSLSYTFQLYFDFSGYTDMAIGTALLFNIKLPINFNSPYKAVDIQDFWRRWHITLSRFLKDYIYIPLGGNRKGSFRTYTNLLATFIIGGIWHGAGWTFVFWGFLHGMALAIHRFWKSIGMNIPKVLAWFITFNFINIAWVFFRAKEWEDAIKVLTAMFDLPKSLTFNISSYRSYFHDILVNVLGSIQTILYIVGAFVLVLFFKNSNAIRKDFKVTSITTVMIALLSIISILHLSQKSEFLYFNF
jgi:D-alanyl-lipoteichoic acid acyltransferase DltB (MBOAT superfamily)